MIEAAPAPDTGPEGDLLGKASQAGKLPAIMADWIDLTADELTRTDSPMEPSWQEEN